MKVRHFGVLVLLVSGVAPLLLAGVSAIGRAERTALDDVRVSNQRVATRVAGELSAHVDSKIQLLRTLGNSLAPVLGLSPKQAELITKGYRILFPTFHSVDVVGLDCRVIATARLEGVRGSRCGETAVDASLRGEVYRGPALLSENFVLSMEVGVPLEVAGERVGAVISEIDLVGIWNLVTQVRVGERGRARVVSRDGTLIAHGEPEERRRVFLRERDPFAPIVASHGGTATYRNSQEREVVATSALIPELGWTVIVEEPIEEAHRAARLMRRDLAVILCGAVLMAVCIGLFVGRGPVRLLEEMTKHVRAVGRGNRETQLELPSRRFGGVEELSALGNALNEMTRELLRFEEESRAKERLATFARVAAGLAHDLQSPIELVRVACDQALAKPEVGRALLRSAAETHLPRLHRYVRDLRRLAQEGEVPLELTTIDPGSLAEKVVGEARESGRWEGVEFAHVGDGGTILADESLLIRALANLLANAGDACLMRKPPGGQVTLRVENREGEVCFCIEDNGVGIAPALLSQLLTSDFKSSKRASGVGLGLGVAKHIALSHGGGLGAESREGLGSAFRLTIPRKG